MAKLLMEQQTLKIGSVEVSISGTAITQPDSGWYYGYKTLAAENIPDGAVVFAVTERSFDANVMVSISPVYGIILRSPVSKTLGINRVVIVYYYYYE